MGLFNALFPKKESLTLTNGWEFFLTTVNDKVTGVRVDVCAIQDKKFARLIHTYFLRVRYTHCYENGLPQPDETQRLNRIEDWLEEQGKALPIWLVGVVTQQGVRDFVFMSEKDLNWEKTLEKLLAGVPDISYDSGMKKNDNGDFYRQVLYPTKYDWNWIYDSRVCRQLQEQGDDLTCPRTIDYYATFPDEGASRAFADSVELLPYGMIIKKIEAYNEREKRYYRVDFINTDVPQQQHMTEITCELLDLAEKNGGSYDGWGTTAEKV